MYTYQDWADFIFKKYQLKIPCPQIYYPYWKNNFIFGLNQIKISCKQSSIRVNLLKLNNKRSQQEGNLYNRIKDNFGSHL